MRHGSCNCNRTKLPEEHASGSHFGRGTGSAARPDHRLGALACPVDGCNPGSPAVRPAAGLPADDDRLLQPHRRSQPGAGTLE